IAVLVKFIGCGEKRNGVPAADDIGGADIETSAGAGDEPVKAAFDNVGGVGPMIADQPAAVAMDESEGDLAVATGVVPVGSGDDHGCVAGEGERIRLDPVELPGVAKVDGTGTARFAGGETPHFFDPVGSHVAEPLFDH